jgi:predicted deacylase
MSLKIGSLEADRGRKRTGYLPVGETSLGKIEMPVTLINGSKPGPRLAMTGGFHPREYTAIESLTRIAKSIKPEEIRGSLIIVHITNTPAFLIRGRKCPIDDAHPINSFPGDPEGSISGRIAYTLAEEVFNNCDYYIDHHSADVQWTGPDNIIYPVTGNDEVDKKSESLARCFDTEYLRASESRSQGNALGYAANNGIPCCLTEVGSMMGVLSKEGVLDEEAMEWNQEGVHNVMKLIGMIDGEAFQAKAKPITNVIYIKPKHSGIFFPLVGVDKEVSKGDAVGEIRDPFGNVIEVLIAPVNGVTSLMSSYMAVEQGIPIIQFYEKPG